MADELTGIRVKAEFEHGTRRYRVHATFDGPKHMSIGCETGGVWELVVDAPMPLKLLAIECLQESLRKADISPGPPYLDVALRDAMDQLRAAQARVSEYADILQAVQDFVDSGGADEPCEAPLRALLAGKSWP